MPATAVNPAATDTSPGHEAEFYRCPLPVERSEAVACIGRQRVKVNVQEASIDGYTILVAASDATKIKIGRPWRLLHEDATLEVLAQWLFQAPDGQVQVGLRRLSDLTPPPKIGGWFPSLTSKRSVNDSSTGTLLFGERYWPRC